MPHRAHRFHRPATPRRAASRRPSETTLFSGVYGLVPASALAAALDSPGEADEPGSDALWVLLTALASAAAHGYAHVVAHRMSADGAGIGLRAMPAEWPVVVAALPTVVLLLTAMPSWWTESQAVNTALVLNTLLLAGWGAWTARRAGRGWAASVRAGTADMLIGLVIIAANALIK
ncbi:hypothetical protein ADK41_32765 [Streptomyces caelestis]|uniref:Integral membrane protein n=1 Tax=Streptomyces caelestis TaxID=36816 RepID=A0A0M8QM84_9ACTN|nr:MULTISPECIES: hypothetical protein [Streptomyces]KOT30597.1 hypothetical protein ADK41_32765 [Streptomyces caelestis]